MVCRAWAVPGVASRRQARPSIVAVAAREARRLSRPLRRALRDAERDGRHSKYPGLDVGTLALGGQPLCGGASARRLRARATRDWTVGALPTMEAAPAGWTSPSSRSAGSSAVAHMSPQMAAADSGAQHVPAQELGAAATEPAADPFASSESYGSAPQGAPPSVDAGSGVDSLLEFFGGGGVGEEESSGAAAAADAPPDDASPEPAGASESAADGTSARPARSVSTVGMEDFISAPASVESAGRELSEEARRLLQALPDLSFMLSTALAPPAGAAPRIGT